MRSSPSVPDSAVVRLAVIVSLSCGVLLCAADGHAQVAGPASAVEFVALHDTPGGGQCDWTRLTADGWRPAFELPEGKALVITSLQWRSTAVSAGSTLEIIRGTGDSSGSPIGPHDRTYELLAMVGGPGHATFPTGLLVVPSSRRQLCWYLQGANSFQVRVTMQGYLVPLVQRAF